MTAAGQIMKGRMKLRSDYPFAGDTLVYLQPRPQEDKSQRMGVDNKSVLHYNAEWVEALTFRHIIAVLIHEILHLILLHVFRVPEEIVRAFENGQVTGRIMMLLRAWNYACDLKVNYMFYEMGLEKDLEDLPGGVIMPTKEGTYTQTFEPFPGKKFVMRIHGIHKKSAEQLYDEIVRFFEKMREECEPQVQKQREELEQMLADAIGEAMGDCGHDGWLDKMDPAEKAQAAADWMVRSAGVLARAGDGKGNIPASLVEALNKLMDPKVDWRGQLQNFVQPIAEAGYTYRRPRRTSWSYSYDVVFPGPNREGVRVICHIDTSGSMSRGELEAAVTELYGILDSFESVHIIFLWSDAGPPKVMNLRETDKDELLAKVKLTGRGGTSHKPVVKWVLEYMEEDPVEALICFTDGDSDIQSCFNDLAGEIHRMLVLTRDKNVQTLSPYCESITYLKTGD